MLCYIHICYILPVFSLCSSGDEGDVGLISHLSPISFLLWFYGQKPFFPALLLNIFLLSLNCGQKDFVNLLYEF